MVDAGVGDLGRLRHRHRHHAVLQKQGVLEPIDYSIVDKSKMQEKFAYEYGCANYMFSFALTYNKKSVSSEPTGWKDFWDLEKFPGNRTLRKQPNGMLEACMMAAGARRTRSIQSTSTWRSPSSRRSRTT